MGFLDKIKGSLGEGGIGQLISGGIGAVGSYFDYKSQKEANTTNERLAGETRKWEERMSNTAYQRAMADMKAAGLNPMLAYEEGGASTPSGPTAQVQPASIGKAISGAFSSALEYKRAAADVKSVDSSASLNKSLERLNDVKMISESNSAKSLFHDSEGKRLRNAILDLQVEYYKKHPKMFPALDYWAEKADTAADVFKALTTGR